MTGLAAQWWDKVIDGFARGPALEPGWPLLLALAAAAAAISIPRATWRWFGLFVTFVHELGHAFAALMTGQVVKGIRLRFDHSGEVRSLGRGGFSAAWTGFWGYPVPAVVGAGLVGAALSGWSGAALSLGALILLVSLLFIRNAAGLAIALGCASVSVLLVWFGQPATVAYAGLVTGTALLVGAVRDWLNLLQVHTTRRRELDSSDAWILYRRTGIPAALWLAAFAAVIAAALAAALYAVGTNSVPA